MRVIITGAAGKIGRQVTEELSVAHELHLIDRVPIPNRKSVVADLSKNGAAARRKSWWRFRRSSWSDSFDGADVVLHLAAAARDDASWETVLHDNIQTTWNIIEGAARHRVPRVIFASSNWAVRALEQRLAPGCYQPGGPKIAGDAPPHPLRPYGLSKAVGELAGQMSVNQGQLRSFLAVRIGAYAVEPFETDKRLRAIWIGAADLRSLFRRCVESPADGFHVVYGVSAQASSPYDLSYTRELLSWEPRQSCESP
jgi:nucleoside-diphosphate-sugar epimerase